MEAGIQLAVIEKLRILVSEDGLHVVCPATPPVYGLADLDAIGRGGATAEELAMEAAWIRAVNVVPTVGSLTPAEPSFLWDRLGELKAQSAEFALPATSAVEASELEAAKSLLFKNPNDEVRQFSDAFQAYLQFQDLHQAAVQLFRQRHDEAENSQDPEVKEFWRQVASKSYQAEIDQAMFKWQELGRKNDIELAQHVLAAAAEREPETQWLRWMAQYSADVDNRGDLNLLQFVPTSFSPTNVGSTADWPETVIDATQIATLRAGAPDDLRTRFDVGGSDVLRVSFEYARLAIERAWFPRRAFTARFWRFRGAGPTLSDGGSPPSGQLPGYIVSALLVRNLSVVRPADSTPTPPRRFDFDRAALFADRLVRADETAKPARAAAMRRDLRREIGPRMHMAGPEAPAVRGAGEARAALDPNLVRAVRETRGNFPSRRTHSAAEFGALGKVDRDMQQRMAVLRQRSILTAPAPTRTEPVIGPAEVCVIAYLWKGFPKCPDPDPSLRWPA